MLTIDIHEAGATLEQLVKQAANGEPFIISKAGQPLVKVIAIDAKPPPYAANRLGFLAGQIKVPDDFDQMGRKKIQRMFEDKA